MSNIVHTELTINSLLREAEQCLTGSDSARLDAEVLLCAVMDFDRTQLYAEPQQTIPADRATQYHALIAQRQRKKPVAYLTGEKEFWSMSLAVNEHTLIPRPETECLVEIALEQIPVSANYHIADLGTGTGAIALAIARERSHCAITATDICANALVIAHSNAVRHGLTHINFLQRNWLENLDDVFDLILSNPPYIRDNDLHLRGDGVFHEPRLALCGGTDGLAALCTIIREATAHLRPHGWLVLEHGYDQAAAVRTLLEESNFTGITTHCDYAGIDRVTCGKCK